MPGIPAGELKWRLSILRADIVDDGFAKVPGPFEEIGKRSAKKTDVRDGERVAAAAQGQSITSRFVVRDDSLTATITAADRVACDGKTYEVTGTKAYGDRGVGIEISAVALIAPPA